MQATDVLRHEHDAIGIVLDSLERASDAVKSGKEVPKWIFRDSLDFIKNFADKCHHHKEEERLFPLLMERGLPTQGGPVQQMLIEHDAGRNYIKQASDSYERWAEGDAAAGITMANAMLSYIELLRSHIQKENNALFPMGDRVLTEADDQELVKDFDDIEEHEMGPGVHEQYHAMIDKLVEATKALQ